MEYYKEKNIYCFNYAIEKSTDSFYDFLLLSRLYEPPHDKTNKMTVRPPKTPISLGIRPVWSESSLCAQWVAKDASFLLADSEDWADVLGSQVILLFCHEAAHYV